MKVKSEAAMADTEAGEKYSAVLRKIIEDGYTAQQVLNVDETGI